MNKFGLIKDLFLFWKLWNILKTEMLLKGYLMSYSQDVILLTNGLHLLCKEGFPLLLCKNIQEQFCSVIITLKKIINTLLSWDSVLIQDLVKLQDDWTSEYNFMLSVFHVYILTSPKQLKSESNLPYCLDLTPQGLAFFSKEGCLLEL
jgi:hypothetical protein